MCVGVTGGMCGKRNRKDNKLGTIFKLWKWLRISMVAQGLSSQAISRLFMMLVFERHDSCGRRLANSPGLQSHCGLQPLDKEEAGDVLLR